MNRACDVELMCSDSLFIKIIRMRGFSQAITESAEASGDIRCKISLHKLSYAVF